MKGHRFKLEAVLKVRKIREDLCKMELGKLQVRVDSLKKFKRNHILDIEQAYYDQEEALKNGLNRQDLQKFPILIEEKRDHIKRIEVEMNDIKQNIEEKIRELAKLKGDVKLISNMKDKSIKNYRKQKSKKENTSLEEQNQNWNLIKDVI